MDQRRQPSARSHLHSPANNSGLVSSANSFFNSLLVRKAIVDDKSLSMTAQNCKVIAKDGAATLTGVVKTTDERDQIASLASSSGAATVVNQLEIAKEN